MPLSFSLGISWLIMAALLAFFIPCVHLWRSSNFICAEYGDRCAMFFDGGIVSVSEACDFFSGNNFYTTVANKIAREHFPDVVTWEEVTRRIKELV